MGRIWRLFLLVLLLPGAEVRAGPMLLAHTLSGGRFYYIVHEGDSFASLGSRFGVDPLTLATANGRGVRSRLKPGDPLWIDNRHIVPANLDDGLLINVPQRMLFVLSSGRLMAAYPVAVGKPGWRTPRGSFTVIEKRKNPTWRVPLSIQAEMAAQGKRVRTRVPPGPDNPLGRHWLGLSLSAIGCHGTIAPLSIYHFRTHGCIRLHPDDASDLFARTELGTPGEIIYSPTLIAQLPDGRIFVEADPDAYRLGSDTGQDLEALAEIRGIGHMISWPKVKEALERRDGLAREVSIWRTCWWDALPMEWRGIALAPDVGELSTVDSCSRLEP